MFKKFISSIFFVFWIISLVFAQVPPNYYSPTQLDGKNTANLRNEFKTIITSGHSSVSYQSLWTHFQKTDVAPNGKVWDIYSNCNYTFVTNQCGNYVNECDCYNREHTVPSSWFNDATPMYTDMFHLYPTDGKVNGIRDNYPFGEVSSPTQTTGNVSKLGNSSFAGYSNVVFEPINEFKGDLARTYFYMATRYADVCQSWGSGATVVFGNNLGLTTYATNLFLKWSRQDPVSQKEINRNDSIFKIQGNRNPFIDFPGVEEYIWGNKTTEHFFVNPNTAIIKAVSLVSSGNTINFGKTSVPVSIPFNINAASLTGNLSINISGTGFSVSPTSISKQDAENGISFTVTFNPLTSGNFQATVQISGGGLTTYELNFIGNR